MTALVIDKTQIEATLDRLEILARSSGPKDTPFFSKMAILELAGWVEETIDAFVKSLTIPRLRDEKVRDRFKEVVKQVHDFTYENHFWRLLGMAIGVVNLERAEEKWTNRV